MPVVEATALEKHYGHGAARVSALRGVDLTVEEREFVAILGRSGSGKSTLMNLLAGLDRPSSGSVVIGGRDLAKLSSNELAAYRSTQIGIVFQSFHLLPGRTALANVGMPLKLDGVNRPERRRRAAEMLAQVGLEARIDHHPNQLSGGEQQRVAIARAMVRAPELLLCDEPTGNLDSVTADGVVELLDTLRREHGRTVLMITHEHELARRLATRMVTLADGRVESARESAA
jgi:putative ABC transport system ATP-binding protein